MWESMPPAEARMRNVCLSVCPPSLLYHCFRCKHTAGKCFAFRLRAEGGAGGSGGRSAMALGACPPTCMPGARPFCSCSVTAGLRRTRARKRNRCLCFALCEYVSGGPEGHCLGPRSTSCTPGPLLFNGVWGGRVRQVTPLTSRVRRCVGCPGSHHRCLACVPLRWVLQPSTCFVRIRA